MGYARDLFQTPGFGDTVDATHFKEHYYTVQTAINPTQIIPAGPDLTGWQDPHDRAELGGRPFGHGTAPGPVRDSDVVPASHTVLVSHRISSG